jgi:uncharacterized delta-60 repeat protein
MITIQDRILKRTGGLLMPLWLALALCAGTAQEARAQAPANDDLTNAQAIIGSSGVVYGNNVNATAETYININGLPTNEPAPYAGNPAQHSIWFLWTAPITTTMDFSTRYSTDTNGNELGTVMAVYTLQSGASLSYTNLIRVASNEYDPSSGVTCCADVTSRVDFPVNSGRIYLIQVDGSTNTPNGSNDVGYVQLNWAASLVGGTFGFSTNNYAVGEFDDEILEDWPGDTIAPSLHNNAGDANIRVTVTRQGGYTGKCEVTMLVTNLAAPNYLETNITGSNVFITNYNLAMVPIGFTNIFFTNVATVDFVATFNDSTNPEYVPVYNDFVLQRTNADGVLSLESSNNLSLDYNPSDYFDIFPCMNLTTNTPPTTSGSVITTTTIQYFCGYAYGTSMSYSASNGVDYVAYSNTLVFNDFQMSQDIYLQINPENTYLAGPEWPDADGDYIFYGANALVSLILTNPVLDAKEDPDITPPTLSSNFFNPSSSVMEILNFEANPFSIALTNVTAVPEYVTVNLERSTFRINKGAAGTTNTAYLYAVLSGLPGLNDSYAFHYTIDCVGFTGLLGATPLSAFNWDFFPTVADSDYAEPAYYGAAYPDFGSPVGPTIDPSGANVGGSTMFPNGAPYIGSFTIGPFPNGPSIGEIAIPIYNWGASEFDVDILVQLFETEGDLTANLGESVPGILGQVPSANLTINYSGVEPGGAYDVSFNPAGSPTKSFPANDLDPGANPPPSTGGVVQAVAIQTNGQAIIGGFFTSYDTTPVYSIARLLTNGWLDPSFNNIQDGGIGNGFVRAIVIPNDGTGRILVGGDFSSYDGVNAPNIARLTSTGALDATFKTGNGFNSTVYALAVDANGNILVGGDFTSYNTTNCNHIARLFPNGALDTTFLPDTGNGLANFGTDQDVMAVATDGNGNIIIGGEFSYVNGRNLNYLARLLPTGAVDTSFVPVEGPDGTVYSLAIETNNEIIIGGAFQNYNLLSSPGVALITTSGALDTTFPVGSGADGNVYSVVLETNGDVLVGGQFRNFNTSRRVGLARLLPNGWIDTSFMDTSYNQFAGLVGSYYNESVEPVHTAYALAVQPDGNIIVGGSFTNIGGGTSRTALNSQVNVTRIIGASTPGPQTGGGGIGNCPGNITLAQSSYTVNDTAGKLFVTLERVNGSLGPAQVTLGTNTLGSGAGAATAADFGLVLPAMPLFNDEHIANDRNAQPGAYPWRASDGNYGNNDNIQPGGFPNIGDATVNLNIYDNPLAQQNLVASLSLLNITELGITSVASNPAAASPLVLGGVVIPCFPALGTPSAPLEIINNNFPVGFVGFSATNYTAVNTSNTVTITVLRTNGSYGPISLTYFTANGTALAGSNYTAVTLAQNKTLNFSGGPNDLSASFTIPILNPGSLQSTKYFKIFLTNSSPSGVFDTNIPPVLPSSATVTIIDGNFAPGHLSFTSPSNGVFKGGLATVSVERLGGALGQLTVKCGTSMASSSPAVNGVNYIGVTNTLSWQNQDVSVKTMTIQTLQDNTVDGNLNVNVSLFDATNIGNINNDSLILFPPTNTTLVIMESDSYGTLNFAAPVSFGVPNFITSQNSLQALITVARASGSTGTVSVNYETLTDTNVPVGYQAAVAGQNYGTTSGTLTFLPGVTSQSFVVPVYNTTLTEASPTNRIVTLVLTNGSASISGQFPKYATLTILDPDLIVGSAGAVDTTTQNGTGFNGFVNSLTLQPNGSILAGGDFTFFNQYPFEYVARLNTDGSFDSSFLFDQAGPNGNVFQVLSQTTNSAQTYNGPIMIAGSFSSVDEVTRNGIARLNIDGSLDETFNPGSGADNTIFALAETLLPTAQTGVTNLSYYIGGSFANFDSVPSGGIARVYGSVNSPGYQGAIDPFFNVGQGVTSTSGTIRALAVQPDNSVVIGGDFTSFNSAVHNHLVRLSPAGVVDPTFNPGTGSSSGDSVRAIAVQPNGQILIGGSFTNVTVSNVTYNLNYLARLNTDGSVDTNFTVGVGGNNSVLALAVDPAQNILVGGEFTTFSGVTRSGITRLTPNGTVDPTINFGSGAQGGFVDTIAIQSNGEIDLGGGFTSFEGISENNFVRLYGGALDPDQSSVQFNLAIYGVLQTATNAVVILQRLGGEAPASIFFSTSDDTAHAGIDYTSVMTNVVFPLGETFETVLIPIINNTNAGSNKIVNLGLSNPSNTVTGVQASAILVITNIYTGVEFSAPTYVDSANSPGGYAIIPIERVGNTNDTVSVTVYTANGSATPYVDYTPTVNTLTFNPGITTLDFDVPLLNATNMFSDLTVGLFMTNPVNTLIEAPSNAVLTIANVLTGPGFLTFSQPNYVVGQGATNAVITIIRTNGSSGAISVMLTTSNGTAVAGLNYAAVNTTVNFADGETNQVVNIPIIPQPSAGPDLTVYLTLSNPQPPPGQGGPTIAGATTEVLTIQNEIENFSFAQANYSTLQSNIVNVSVQRGGPATNTATVSYYTVSPANASETNGYAVPYIDYVPVSGTLTFASNQPQSIPISILQGKVVYGPLTFQVVLTNPGPAGVVLAPPSTNTVTIYSDLTAFEFSTNSYIVAENGSNLAITVDRINTTSPAASVQFATSNGTNQNTLLNAMNGVDYVATSGVLTFTNGQTNAGFVITILNPNILEGNKTFNLALSDPLVNTNPAYLVPPSNAVVTITNVLTSTTKIVPSPITVYAYASSAFLVWTTPINATVQVAYGLTTNFGNLTSLSAPSTNHVVVLTGLTRNATYYYNAVSWFDVSPYPRPYATNGSFATLDTIILTTDEAYKTGLWQTGSTAITNYYGSFYYVANTAPLNNPSSTATYSPTIITPGFYNVFSWYPTNASFSTNTQVIVDGATNTILEGLNQTTHVTTTNGQSWQPIGTNIYFAAGANGNVIIENDTGESNKFTVANAMMWNYVDAQDYPPSTNGTVPSWWSTFYTNSAAADSNFFDYVFGLNPNDPTSTLTFGAGAPVSNVVTAYFWPYAGGRVYSLQASTNLATSQWLTLTNVPFVSTNAITNSAGLIFTNGTGYGGFTVTLPNAAALFYRLAAQLGTNY